MKHSLAPAACSVALTCMIAAGASHWWSVKQLVTLLDGPQSASRMLAMNLERGALPSGKKAAPVPEMEAPGPPAPQPAAIVQQPPAELAGEPAAMQQFYQELIREMQQLRTQNRDLLNQVAETNRDLMKLEFRVDTHSEQFRPLPVAEDNFGTTFDTSFDDSPGLLPPRAEPVVLPLIE